MQTRQPVLFLTLSGLLLGLGGALLARGRTAPEGSRLSTAAGDAVDARVVRVRRRRLVARAHRLGRRRRCEAALVRVTEEVHALARFQNAFLANLSHEIRTPLTSMVGFAELLEEEMDPAQRDLAELIRRNGERLLTTLHAVLDLARLESKTMPYVAQRVDLAAHVQAVVRTFEAQAGAKGLTLVFRNEAGGPVYAEVDPEAFEQSLAHLLSNALKFTHQGGVTVTLRDHPDHVACAVADTGIGIGPEFLPRIFDAFTQASRRSEGAREGCGLGLALTHHLLALMGATLDVESAPGRGSVFTVKLPREFGKS